MIKKKIFGYLGIAKRGRNLVSGSFMVEKTIKSGRAKLVIVSEDASNNTKKLFFDKCKFYNVPVFTDFNRYDLGSIIGSNEKVVIAITDNGIANVIEKLFQDWRSNESNK